MSGAKRIMAAILVSALMLVVMAAPALAFHHRFVPADACGESPNAGGNNPTATAAIKAHNPAQGDQVEGLPLPPAGTPGANQGAGDEHCPNA